MQFLIAFLCTHTHSDYDYYYYLSSDRCVYATNLNKFASDTYDSVGGGGGGCGEKRRQKWHMNAADKTMSLMCDVSGPPRRLTYALFRNKNEMFFSLSPLSLFDARKRFPEMTISICMTRHERYETPKKCYKHLFCFE